MVATILALAALILYIAIAIVLVRKYLRTRDAGFVWLGVAVVIWPFISRLLQGVEKALMDRLVRHQPVGLYPFSLVENGQMTIGSLAASLALVQQLIGICLLLVAVLYLSKTKNDGDLQPAR